ncbi:uncharacterized protein EMH_0056570 [Eimeria mitis]|uniref:Uncharacterized protein n=1 Tax=Eimeria mitis TaxID=44415 RepID=U6K3B4_9EIME|nr:uncharacterized protein EMH_0056570 [Eimeria mitis]CDJ30258.1 hypothetical protein EMH_0056570 [Eimeria mitis]
MANEENAPRRGGGHLSQPDQEVPELFDVSPSSHSSFLQKGFWGKLKRKDKDAPKPPPPVPQPTARVEKGLGFPCSAAAEMVLGDNRFPVIPSQCVPGGMRTLPEGGPDTPSDIWGPRDPYSTGSLRRRKSGRSSVKADVTLGKDKAGSGHPGQQGTQKGPTKIPIDQRRYAASDKPSDEAAAAAAEAMMKQLAMTPGLGQGERFGPHIPTPEGELPEGIVRVPWHSRLHKSPVKAGEGMECLVAPPEAHNTHIWAHKEEQRALKDRPNQLREGQGGRKCLLHNVIHPRDLRPCRDLVQGRLLNEPLLYVVTIPGGSRFRQNPLQAGEGMECLVAPPEAHNTHIWAHKEEQRALKDGPNQHREGQGDTKCLPYIINHPRDLRPCRDLVQGHLLNEPLLYVVNIPWGSRFRQNPLQPGEGMECLVAPPEAQKAHMAHLQGQKKEQRALKEWPNHCRAEQRDPNRLLTEVMLAKNLMKLGGSWQGYWAARGPLEAPLYAEEEKKHREEKVLRGSCRHL